jgi:scyllo-inositol 2-dehydrogenase (NADP+)
MADLLLVGLVGYGFAGRIFHAPLIHATPGMRLAAIVSSRPEAVHSEWPQIKVVANLAALLADPQIDLVVLATPNQTHFPLAQAALQAGRHVVVDKPFTLTVAEADVLIDLAEEQGVLLSVFHNRRWDNDFLTIQHLIAQGALGEVMTLESHFDRFRPGVRDRWREWAEPGAGLLYDLGSHLIDQALVLFGSPDHVWADLGRQREGAQIDDYFHLVLRFGEKRAILHAGSLVVAPPFRFAVHGAKGSYVKQGLDPQEDQLKQGIRPGESGWGIESADDHGVYMPAGGEPVVVESRPGTYEAYYAGIVKTIRDRSPLPVTATAARKVISVIESARRMNH